MSKVRGSLIAGFAVLAGLALPGVEAQRATNAQAPARPNIVLIVPDNLGWGEVGASGSVRGAPTPRLDRLAAQGIRLTNFNVEFSCTVSRAALVSPVLPDGLSTDVA
mgnify:CR=1 FL=1